MLTIKKTEINNNYYGLIYKYTYLPDKRMYYGQVGKKKKDSKMLSLERSFQERQKEHLTADYNEVFHDLLREENENFKLEIVEFCFSREELDNKEEFRIKKDNTNVKNGGYGFNLTDGANPPIMRGEECPASKRKGKFYEELYGEKKAREIKEKLSQSVPRGEGHYATIFTKGKTYEEIHGEEKAKEIKEKIILSQKDNHPRKGKKHTKETKRKISKAKKQKIENVGFYIEILKNYANKGSIRKIAKKYNLGSSTIRSIINFKGKYEQLKEFIEEKLLIQIEKNKNKKCKTEHGVNYGKRKLPDEDIKRLITLSREKKKTQKELTEMFPVSQGTIGYILSFKGSYVQFKDYESEK